MKKRYKEQSVISNILKPTDTPGCHWSAIMIDKRVFTVENCRFGREPWTSSNTTPLNKGWEHWCPKTVRGVLKWLRKCWSNHVIFHVATEASWYSPASLVPLATFTWPREEDTHAKLPFLKCKWELEKGLRGPSFCCWWNMDSGCHSGKQSGSTSGQINTYKPNDSIILSLRHTIPPTCLQYVMGTGPRMLVLVLSAVSGVWRERVQEAHL